MRLTNRHGFTLVEILTVVTIIGIMTAIAIPGFSTWIPNMRLKSDARDLYSNLQKAKLEAVKQNSCTGVVFTPVVLPATGGSYAIFVDDGAGAGTPCNAVQDGGENIVSTTAVSNGVSLTNAPNMGAANTVCFTPTSVICGSRTGTVQLGNAAKLYRARLAASGGVRLQWSTDNGISWND